MNALRIALALALVIALPALANAAGDRPETWTVVGLRTAEAPAIGEEVAILRGALSLELSARGRGDVHDEEQTELRLGMRSASLRSVADRIDAAELYYFQLELGIARTNLEQALAELAHSSGIPEAWERLRAARIMLGMIHLARRDDEGRRLAAEQFALVARLQPRWSPADSAYPAEVVERYAEARRQVEAAPRGTLRAICEPACPGGHLYLDAFPVAAAGGAIELPAGRYQLVITDRFENPGRRSFPREITIRAGEETRLGVDLEEEGGLVAEAGPVLIGPADPAGQRQAAVKIARRLGSDRVLVLLAGPGGGWNAWLVDPGGKVLRELAIPPGAAGGVESLAQLAVSEGLPGPSAPIASLGQLTAAGQVEAQAPPDPGSLWTTMRWSTVGAAAIAASLGLYLHLDANDRDEALRSRAAGVLSSEGAARAAHDELASIRRQADWGSGLLVGAGVLSATALTLFLLDGDVPETSVRW